MHVAGTFQQKPVERLEREFQHHGQRQASSNRQICRNKLRSCRKTFMQTTHPHTVTSDGPSINALTENTRVKVEAKTLKGSSSFLTLKTFLWSLASGSLSGRPGAFRSWTRVAAAECVLKVWLDSKSSDLRSGQNFRSVWSRWKDAPGPSPDPRRVDPKLQCSPLSQAKKK